MLVSDRQKYFAGRAPVVQCRRHFRQFPRFVGELPERGSLIILMHSKKLGGKFAKISFTGFAPF